VYNNLRVIIPINNALLIPSLFTDVLLSINREIQHSMLS
jgi:hypothetical protein